jgi:hypothetical protein
MMLYRNMKVLAMHELRSDTHAVMITQQLRQLPHTFVLVATSKKRQVDVHAQHAKLQRGAGPMALMLWLDWVT